MQNDVKELLSDAKELVSAHCSQILRSVGEMGFVGQEQEAFCRLVSAQLLGASLDLWTEIQGDDPAPLEKFVSLRLQAKTARDSGLKHHKKH